MDDVTERPTQPRDIDPIETAEWLASIEAVHHQGGTRRTHFLLDQLHRWALKREVPIPFAANTPYINTIPKREQPPYPGDRKIERRIKSYARWNAMAMVVRGNRESDGIGGHISTFASSATLYEVGFNHFFRAKTEHTSGDHIFFQGHASPGIYARAFLEGRLSTTQLHNFRREFGQGGGLSSYPHPWLMPDFWEFPTVSMGLGPINSIYQARFNRYLEDRGLMRTSGSRVWAFLGDGEMDEPESLGAIHLAAREHLDNLTWVINCNLQRLDGPVRGNGNIIQELEANFRGAGWNVIKVIWGSDWDPLFAADTDGLLIQHMHDVVDGQWQRFTVESGSYSREHFFGRHPEMLRLVDRLTDEQIRTLRLGGHDPEKVYAAYAAAAAAQGRPNVILVRTIKGYGLGEAGEGKNITHQQKKLNEDELRAFRDRFEIPISDKELKDAPFCRFDEGSPEYEYLHERRKALGGYVPQRKVRAVSIEPPERSMFDEFLQGSGDRAVATTMALVRMLNRLMSDKRLGKLIVPIVPDEARTFGMEALFRSFGIYAHAGQLYEPVDAHLLMRYEERKNGQILEEGITECGSMASWIAAGSAYATHGLTMIPFFLFYSMFGFQRVGDSIWLAADQRCRGFLCGATAGRTTLNGEGLQHQDGHSLLHASTVPTCQSYDAAFAFELALIVQDGIRRMYEDGEDIFYYLTIYNETYPMPAQVPGCEEGVLKGFYKFRAAEKPGKLPRIHLFGSGPLMQEALRAQELLRERYKVAADVWSVTSYNQLYREAMACRRWNRLHPAAPQRVPYFSQKLAAEPWPIVTTSDYVSTLAERLAPFAPAGMSILSTDGFGRSETRRNLRNHFETTAEFVTLAALTELAQREQFDRAKLPQVVADLGIDPEKRDPATA
ncbi:MAG: pyruvate dehydrogenase (acetyl-transferring), homodimeric type [Phycisphaerales bacterium]|nr:pyruvate dehydrogenase (acetyl-transferring), homodimeric type [Phycisphaerales bacterium]